MCPFLPGLPKSLSKALHGWALQSPNYTSSFLSHLSLLTNSYSAFEAQLWHQHPTDAPSGPDLGQRPVCDLQYCGHASYDMILNLSVRLYVFFLSFWCSCPSGSYLLVHAAVTAWHTTRAHSAEVSELTAKLNTLFSSPSTPDLQFPDLQ